MKKINKFFFGGCMLCLAFTSCSDFDDLNTDPTAIPAADAAVEYALNKSITFSQQDPHIAERVFVLTWKTAARQHAAGGIATGTFNDAWISDYYKDYLSSWLSDVNNAITLADAQLLNATGENLKLLTNMKQVARIWRVYLMSEFADNFGVFPINAFDGKNPQYNDAKEAYYFFLAELKDAVALMSPDTKAKEGQAKFDRAYGYDFQKWVKYGNSMRMRLAMRLSEVDAEKAKTEFVEAVNDKGGYIAVLEDNFSVQERDGWAPLTGVMSRQWNPQILSVTMNNLFVGLGGIPTSQLLSEERYQKHIKELAYIGKRYEQHYSLSTSNPTAGFWFDGLPYSIDPRAYKLFSIPGDFDNNDYCYYPSWNENAKTQLKPLLSENKKDTLQLVNAAFSWNAAAIGNYGVKGELNQLIGFSGTNPSLVLHYRNSTDSRVFFAAWESYFLIAEAAVRGWNVPLSDKEAYEKGVGLSFEYNKVTKHLVAYLSSDAYNNVGTSVAWNHTEEPPATKTMKAINGYTGAEESFEYKYPVAANTLYGKALNDKLTKIITQKYLANMPWLPLEAWNDHRRLGLPFFETPAVEQPLVDMPQLTKENYEKQTVKFFPQRLRLPSALRNGNSSGYLQAVEKLNGEDDVFTPIWWAKQK